jgi:hypothetical protein
MEAMQTSNVLVRNVAFGNALFEAMTVASLVNKIENHKVLEKNPNRFEPMSHWDDG